VADGVVFPDISIGMTNDRIVRMVISIKKNGVNVDFIFVIVFLNAVRNIRIVILSK
jgi:hypothetical protein